MYYTRLVMLHALYFSTHSTGTQIYSLYQRGSHLYALSLGKHGQKNNRMCAQVRNSTIYSSLELSFEMIAPKGSHCFVAESTVKLSSSRKQNLNLRRLRNDLDPLCHNLLFNQKV